MGLRSHRRVSGQGGFTLVELLVVIAIVGLLITLLLPALSKAKAMSTIAVCATVQGGIGRSIYIYAADFKDSVPHRQPIPSLDGESLTAAWLNAGQARVAGLSIWSQRNSGASSLSALKREDGVSSTDNVNVPTGLGQLVKGVRFGTTTTTTQATTSYYDTGYLQVENLFCPNDKEKFELGRPTPRNSWWSFRAYAFGAKYTATWSSNANYNNANYPSGNAMPVTGAGNNYFYRCSYADRSGDFASLSATSTLVGFSSTDTRRTSGAGRHNKAIACDRQTELHSDNKGMNILYNDGAVKFRSNDYYAAGLWQLNNGVGGVQIFSATDTISNASFTNPYTGEVGVSGFKLTTLFACIDKYITN